MERPRPKTPQPEDQPQQCLPFRMTEEQISIIQNIADGKTDREYVKEGAISLKSLVYYKANLAWLGLPANERITQASMDLLVPALIQDGINQGYINPPEFPDTPVSIKGFEEVLLNAICDGETITTLHRRFGTKFNVNRNNIRNIVLNLRDKFGAKNENHLIALYTACKNNNLVEII